MALPATITLRHSVVGSSLNEVTFSPTPHSFPDNISGKTCLLSCKTLSFDPSVAPTTPSTTDSYILSCTLPQPFSRVMTSTGSYVGRCVIGTFVNGQSYDCGPVVVNIPEGPVDMSFTISRTDGGAVCGTSSTNTVLICLSIAPLE